MKKIFYIHCLLFLPISMYFIFFNEIMFYFDIVPENFTDTKQYFIVRSDYMRYGITVSWLQIVSLAFSALVFVMFSNRTKSLGKIETHYFEGCLVLFSARAFFELAGLFYGSSVQGKWYLTFIVALISLGYFIFERKINRNLTRL